MDGSGKYKQWITLFDHIDDDEYDGEMGETDDEPPRVHFSFHIQNETGPLRVKDQVKSKLPNSIAASKSPVREPIREPTREVSREVARDVTRDNSSSKYTS